VQLNQPNGSAASVAVDPQDEQRIYVAGTPGNWRRIDSAVVRSVDGGLTWEKLNDRSDLQYDGGNCATWCRVNPLNRDLWVATSCFGMWRFGVPTPFAASLSLTNSGVSAQGELSWDGGAPPYVVQSALNLTSSWTSISTNLLNSGVVSLTDRVGFFRMQGPTP
jgi:hypothetical protein